MQFDRDGKQHGLQPVPAPGAVSPGAGRGSPSPSMGLEGKQLLVPFHLATQRLPEPHPTTRCCKVAGTQNAVCGTAWPQTCESRRR